MKMGFVLGFALLIAKASMSQKSDEVCVRDCIINSGFAIDGFNAARLCLESNTTSHLDMYGIRATEISCYRNTYDILFFRSASFKDAVFSSDRFGRLIASGVKGDRLFFSNCIFQSGSAVAMGAIDSIYFSGGAVHAELTFSLCPDIKYLSIVGTKIGDVIDLTPMGIQEGNECTLTLARTDFSKIKLNYKNFRLAFNADYTTAEILTTYEQMLEAQKSFGFHEGYKKLDIEYQNYQLQQDWTIQKYLSKIWWNYGHARHWIFYWILLFFAIVIVIVAFVQFSQ